MDIANGNESPADDKGPPVLRQGMRQIVVFLDRTPHKINVEKFGVWHETGVRRFTIQIEGIADNGKT